MIIVTLSVVCTLKGMSRWSTQRIKAILLCIVYAILFVNTVDMKIKAHNALNAMFVETVDTTVKTHPHIPAHNFLNIQPIFNSEKSFGKLRLRAFQLYHQILYMLILSIQVMAFYTKYNTFNAMHVDTVNTVEKP